MNGLMNKLSDQSKDSIIREIKGIFDNNSLTVTNLILKDCVMAACSNSTQTMTTLIPVYASLVSGLHFAVGVDVGAYIIESLCVSLFKEIKDAKLNSDKSLLISSKLSSNSLLLLIFFYNLKILHHTLIVDIMKSLAGIDEENSTSTKIPSFKHDTIDDLEIELLVILIDHCGPQLRGDDPVGLRTVISTLTKRSNSPSNKDSARVRFMLEALTDLKNNKSRRTQGDHAEVAKKMRKWLGSIKAAMTTKSIDPCLRVSLKDLLDAEKRGRWWRAGASWAGTDTNSLEKTMIGSNNKNNINVEVTQINKNSGSAEEQKLLKLAKKLRFNTATRRSIFVVIMSSRDINDAFERLGRLELKGKQDREIVRVIIECCGQEKNYNLFYAELSSLLISQNRQYKTTFQFSFWDFFKILNDDDSGDGVERKSLNLARLLGHLVSKFHLPLSVIKPIDMSNINGTIMLLLATFFMSLFSTKVIFLYIYFNFFYIIIE
jgi:nucleolar MIF4G domain-containing protein 1